MLVQPNYSVIVLNYLSLFEWCQRKKEPFSQEKKKNNNNSKNKKKEKKILVFINSFHPEVYIDSYF